MLRSKFQGEDNCLLMQNCGEIAGEHSMFLNHFIVSFGKSLLLARHIPERIDFLTNTVNKQTTLSQTVTVGTCGDTVYLTDEIGDFRNISILITNNAEDGQVYSIREFNEQPSEVFGTDIGVYKHALVDPSPHWNFCFTADGIEIFSPSDAFSEPYKTRAVVNMIVWTSNMLGFEQQKSP